MQLRVARHTERLDELVRFYRDGIGLTEIGGFRDHDGYDGVFLAVPGTGAHLELTSGGEHGASTPHPESLLVLYLGDAGAAQTVAARLGVEPISPANPYWAEHGGHELGPLPQDQSLLMEYAEAIDSVTRRSTTGPGYWRAMSRENVEVVRRQFEAFERGLDAVVEFWHSEIEWRAVEGAADDVGVIHGEAELRRYYQDWIEIFEQLRAEVQEVIFAEGERVACVIRNSGRARASGVRTGGRYYVVCTLRDGKIASGREYATRAEALDAVGLRE